ncbi:hypothetical protein QZH41_009277, partial [Actinostola sp. cb2023]
VNSEVARYLAFTGVLPAIHVESRASIPDKTGHYNAWFIDTLQTALVDLGRQDYCDCLQSELKRCYCDSNHPTCIGHGPSLSSDCCDSMELDCSTSSLLCNPAWLAPLPRREWVSSLQCNIGNLGLGPYIGSKSGVLHVDGFHNNQHINTVGSKAVHLPQIVQPVPLNCVTQHSPSCVVTGLSKSNVILYSSSEFAVTEIMEVQGIFNGTSVCAEHYSSLHVIKGSISLLDTIIFNTPLGLIEMKGSLKSPLLATHGKPVTFRELLDYNHLDACQFLNNHLYTESDACSMVTASIISAAEVTALILVEIAENSSSSHYHIMRYEGLSETGQWVLVFSIPIQLPATHGHGDDWFIVDQSYDNISSVLQQPVLHGMSHTAVISNNIFLWGNMLLYSPQEGLSLQRLTSFPLHSTIIVFTSSLDGTYAFLTDTDELWVGMVGSAKLLKVQAVPDLWPLNTPWDFYDNRTVVTMFFDSTGRLQQVVSDRTQSCVSRQHVPLHDIIASQNFHETRFTKWKKDNLIPSNNSSCTTTTPQEMPSSSMNYVERTCPYAKMAVFAPQSVLYSRKMHYTVEPPPILDSKLVHSMDEAVEYLTSTSNDSIMEFTHVGAERLRYGLPGEISLHRSESYGFELYLYLDYVETVETSRHSWTMDHLRVSFYISHPSFINVTSSRKELLPFKAVKYQVTVQDMGFTFTQHPPGKGLVPVSLELKAWSSAFSCLEESDDVKTSQVMTIYLGCPANHQVVFDGQMSMNADSQKHFCDPGQSVTCFLFERAFYPLFDFVDLVTGHVTPFLGQYTLRIVGGGLDLDSIRDYSPQEIRSCNFKYTGATSPLIWAAKQKSLATVPVFNRSVNGIQWLCGTESPCANIAPKLAGNAQFYFTIEFSNRGVGDTNCDYTLRFTIRVHGLPPGSLHPSSIIVLSCLGIIITVTMTLFIFKRKDQNLLKKTKALFNRAFRCRDKTSVQRVEQTTAAETDGLEMGNMKAVHGTVDEPIRNRGNGVIIHTLLARL